MAALPNSIWTRTARNSFVAGRVPPARVDVAVVSGSYIPFPETEEEAALTGDPRVPVLTRYATADAYTAAIRTASEQLVHDRFLLPEDVGAAIAMAARWGRVNHSHSL
ncbi:alpha/beta hydrolase domain-containing protein [Falsirhodobacter xinxiangensis]|uniref:alpha/beta hydrolase domain-containing protein n=1 Tax=Falsirhodobacter xinxiangensis TaxID=2530049 RepID=UPI0010A9F774|nr:alpha/beta hydrolase domain-containing protein [Rhodobacter xinxiangensis]